MYMNIYMYMYVYMCMCMCMCIYMYMYMNMYPQSIPFAQASDRRGNSESKYGAGGPDFDADFPAPRALVDRRQVLRLIAAWGIYTFIDKLGLHAAKHT